MTNKKSKIVRSIIIVIAVILIGYFFIGKDSGDEISGESIKIGAILPLSGPNEFYGNEIRNGIELAREEINEAEGINGRMLEVIYEDDQANPAIGTSAMQKLANIDKVPVVLGSWVSGVVIASAPVAEKVKVIVMAQAISPKITDAGDYIFRIQPSAIYYSEKLMEAVINELDLKRIGVIYLNNEFGVTLRDAVINEAERLGGRVVVTEGYSQGDQDFRSQLTKIKAQNPEALFIGGYQEQALIIRQAAELDLKTKLLAGPPFENKQLIDDLGKLAEGILYPYHFVAQTDNLKTIAYMNAYKSRFGVDTGGFAPLIYDAVYIIADALKKCGEDTDCVKNAIYKTEYDGISGYITFDENGDPLSEIVLKTVKNGEFVKFEK